MNTQESKEPKEMTKQERRALVRERKRKRLEKQISTVSVLVLAVTIGLISLFLLVFPRSTTSNIEKRELTKFPSFSLSSYFSGEFTSGIASWYDDTVPFRDAFKKMGSQITALAGFSSDNTVTFVNADINEAAANGAEEQKAEKEDNRTIAEKEKDQKDYTEEEADAELQNGILIVKTDDHWRALSLFGGGSSDTYVETLNTLQEKVGKDVKIYSMPAPLSSEFYTPSNAQEYTTSQSDFYEEIGGKLDKKITALNLCDVMKKHTEEDIYLRTDHHWTALGAYYACRTLAEAADVPFADLDEYTEGVNEGYVGTMYAYTQDSRILNDPEDFVYYVPNCKTHTYYYDQAFNYQFEDDLIIETDVENSYSMFIHGDGYAVKVMTEVNNDRKLLVVKDSFGDAMIPFLTSSFEEIYVVDQRYFECNLVNMIKKMGITDVVFASDSYSIVGDNANYLTGLITQNPDGTITDDAPIPAKSRSSTKNSDTDEDDTSDTADSDTE